jgi:hypothetical protein
MNLDSTGSAAVGMAVTFPCIESVRLGRVSVEGSVETEATCIAGDVVLARSIMETSNGRDGLEKSRSYGTGLMAVAVPWTLEGEGVRFGGRR